MGWLILFFLAVWWLMALSIFNMLLLTWLGITVFLAAEHRTIGLWLILAGMGMASVFFTSHSMILGNELTRANPSTDSDLWWHIGWIPVICTPLLWYLVMLWYTGFWNESGSRLVQRHRLPVMGVTGYAVGLLGLLLVGDGLPSFEKVAFLNLAANTRAGGVPLLFLLYPPFIVLTILLPLDALRHPQPSHRMMGDLARARSRSWLLRVSWVMVAVSLLVTGFVYWVLFGAVHWQSQLTSAAFIPFIAAFDLLITVLATLMILMLGQAVISYEIFTGNTLPRRGFRRHWRNAIITAGGTASFISLSLLFHWPTSYSLFVLGGLLMVFFALVSWRSFVHRASLIQHLRPFINNQDSPRRLFESICAEMLHTQQACLLPMIPPLAHQPIFFRAPSPIPQLPTASVYSQTTRIIPLATNQAYQWAIPIWSMRGLIGLLLIGPKDDGGLYTQEEVEAASAGAERIIEWLLRDALGARVLAVERQRQQQQRLLDRQARRVLHDEVLPDLHLAILGMGDSPTRAALMAAHRKISDLIRNTAALPTFAEGVHDVLHLLRGLLHSEFEGAFEQIEWQGAASFPLADALTRDVVVNAAREIIRNAAKHGRGEDHARPLTLTIRVESSASLLIADDGVGQRQGWLKNDGGLSLHSTLLAIVGGELQVTYPTQGGTQVRIVLNPH